MSGGVIRPGRDGAVDSMLLPTGGMSFGFAPRLQVAIVRDGTRVLALVIGQGPTEARAYLLAFDAATDGWTAGRSMLSPCKEHHDVRAVVSATKAYPATVEDMRRFGLIGRTTLPGFVASMAMQGSRRRGEAAGGAGALRAIDDLMHLVMRRPDHALPGVTPVPTGWGYPADDPREDQRRALAVENRRIHARPQGDEPRASPGIVIPVRFVDDEIAPYVVNTDEIAAAIDVAVAELAACHHAEATEILGSRNWTAAAYAFYAAGGEVGERRRQAGRLYPALSPLIARFRTVHRDVDAARPYEDALRAAAQDILVSRGCKPFRTAALRRMRSLPGDTPFKGIVLAVDIAARVPIDRVPATEDAWRIALRLSTHGLAALDALGLDLAETLALSRGGWIEVAALSTGEYVDPRALLIVGAHTASAINGMTDMARRLSTSLVIPFAESIGHAVTGAEGLRMAGGILFGGTSARSMNALQSRWHRGIVAFEAALPSADAGNAWPAAFPPYVAANGLTIRCLTDEAELRREGRALAHCVGGYGKVCHEGLSHVASVGRATDTGWSSLSTVELVPVDQRGERRTLGLKQHRSHRNREPTGPEREAVRMLVDALLDGSHPILPDALVEKGRPAYLQGYDWRQPGLLQAAFDAWAPFLPGEVARAGLDGLRKGMPTSPG